MIWTIGSCAFMAVFWRELGLGPLLTFHPSPHPHLALPPSLSLTPTLPLTPTQVKRLGVTLTEATSQLLDNNKSPSRKGGQVRKLVRVRVRVRVTDLLA